MFGRKNEDENVNPYGQGSYGMGINPMMELEAQMRMNSATNNGVNGEMLGVANSGMSNSATPNTLKVNQSINQPISEPTNEPVQQMPPVAQPMEQQMPQTMEQSMPPIQPTGQPVAPMGQPIGRPRGFRQWGAPQGQMAGQMQMPAQMAGQIPNQMPMQSPYNTNQKDPKKGLIIGAIIGAVVIIAVIAIVAIVTSGQPPEPTPEPEPEPTPKPEVVDDDVPTVTKVNSFCNTNDLYLHTLTDKKGDYDGTSCMFYSEDDATIEKIVKGPEGDFASLDYFLFKEKFDEVNPFKDMDGDYSSLGVTLNDTTDYKVFYYVDNQYEYELFVYSVLYKNSYLSISAKTATAIEKALKKLGYPEWKHDVPTAEDYKAIMEKEAKEKTATPAKRDVVRKQDFDRVMTALMQYKTNHSDDENKYPAASVWVATEDFKGKNDCDTNPACMLIRDSLNDSTDEEKKNTFIDPSGKYYNLLITENWAIAGDIENTTFNDKSKLSYSNKTYTISDSEAFDEHVIYIIPGGICGEDTVKIGTKDNVALLYRLEEKKTYCKSA